MEIRHTRALQFIAKQRGHEVTIDQPGGAGGFDKGMTPPELFVASLGACIGVYVVDFCERHSIDTEGMKIRMSWEKASDPPNRIGRIHADVDMPAEIPDSMRAAVQRVAEQCLIHNTIMHTPTVKIEIHAPGA